MTRWVDADSLNGLLKPGMTVFVAGATAEPQGILDSLSRNNKCCEGVRFVSVSIPGINSGEFASFSPKASSTAFFATPQNRMNIESDNIDFVPMQYSTIFKYLQDGLPIDVALVQLPPLQNDAVSLGLSADFVPAILEKATLVVAEINERQPTPVDSILVPLEKIDFAIKCDRPVPVVAESKVDEVAQTIGVKVSELINDGDCLQIGIGGIPNAVLDALKQKNDLGIHSGLISDAVMHLAESGNISGRCKTQDREKIVTGTTLGSEELIQWAGRFPDLRIRPVSYTHDIGVLRSLDNLVSVNSAIEVDLFGQVNADMLGGRQWTGPGGAVDMMRGAGLSKGGRSIVALKATASAGKKSKIVSALDMNTAATALRTDVDYVVTEYGARHIRYLPVTERAKALIELAAPEFRVQLSNEWQSMRTKT
ncbi:MAG: hypothetical protein CMO98_01125 [Woeseia sp.]|nr:hypothetical protein [Woeseia sp.]|tara:strand:- start:1403 stop:2674 length:1272 start_codon:yes stop_codon:yes gene_type:complete